MTATTDGLLPGERCHAVVRPEKLRIEPLGRAAGAANGLPRVEGIVESSLYLGTATQIVVDLGDEVRMTVLVPNASEAERQRLPGGGARVALSWEPEHMHVVRESPGTAGPAPSEIRKAGRAELEASQQRVSEMSSRDARGVTRRWRRMVGGARAGTGPRRLRRRHGRRWRRQRRSDDRQRRGGQAAS